MNRRYFRPRSLTWWSGVIAIGLGGLAVVAPNSLAVSTFSEVLSALMGGADASPAQLILTGLAVIGIRDKMERG